MSLRHIRGTSIVVLPSGQQLDFMEDSLPMTEPNFQSLIRLLENGAKVEAIEEEDAEITVRVVAGIDLTPHPPELLLLKTTLKRSVEVENFLNSPLAAAAILRPVKRGIILVDIMDYSKGDTVMQAAFLSIFQLAIKEQLRLQRTFAKDEFVDQIVPTGDGCYIVFHESVNDRFFRVVFGLLSSMNVVQNRILKAIGRDHKSGKRVDLRVGCEIGETDFFFDISGNRNCFGPGMNEAARILSCGEAAIQKRFPDHPTGGSIFLGANVHPQARALHQWLTSIQPGTRLRPLGNLKDKHHSSRNVWWMTGVSKFISPNLFSFQELLSRLEANS